MFMPFISEYEIHNSYIKKRESSVEFTAPDFRPEQIFSLDTGFMILYSYSFLTYLMVMSCGSTRCIQKLANFNPMENEMDGEKKQMYKLN